MVQEVFRLAKESTSAFIFIDVVDAIAVTCFVAQTVADREVQRILMELLNQMDRFDQAANVKVIRATKRSDTPEPALLRPGRLGREIELPFPCCRQKRLVLQVLPLFSSQLYSPMDIKSYHAVYHLVLDLRNDAGDSIEGESQMHWRVTLIFDAV